MDLAGLKTNLKAVYDATKVDAGDPVTQEENFINGMAEAIQTFVLTAELTYGSGLVAGATAVTGDIIGGLK
jgi:hypothetical protein